MAHSLLISYDTPGDHSGRAHSRILALQVVYTGLHFDEHLQKLV